MKIRGFGSNLQNLDKSIRSVIIAPPGKVIWNIDESGADAMIVAYLCKMGRFRSLFIHGVKPHIYVALHIAAPHWAKLLEMTDIEEYLSCPIAELKKKPRWSELSRVIADSDNDPNPQKRYYYIAKQCCHLLNYDAGWRQFQLTTLTKSEGSLAFTDTQAKYYRSLYRDTLFPELSVWHCEVIGMLEANNRVLCNLFGYPRKFHGAWSREDLFKIAYAFIPQSTVSMITLEAGNEIQERIDKKDSLIDGVNIFANVHDSIAGYAKEDNWVESVKSLVPHIERNLTNFKGEKFQMRSGTSIGKNWSPYHPVKNPEGLREYDWTTNKFK